MLFLNKNAAQLMVGVEKLDVYNGSFGSCSLDCEPQPWLHWFGFGKSNTIDTLLLKRVGLRNRNSTSCCNVLQPIEGD